MTQPSPSLSQPSPSRRHSYGHCVRYGAWGSDDPKDANFGPPPYCKECRAEAERGLATIPKPSQEALAALARGSQPAFRPEYTSVSFATPGGGRPPVMELRSNPLAPRGDIRAIQTAQFGYTAPAYTHDVSPPRQLGK